MWWLPWHTPPAVCRGWQGHSPAQKGPGTPLRAREMLSNGGDVPLASKEGAAAEGPHRGGLEEEKGRRGSRPRAEVLPQAAPQLEQRHSCSPGKDLCQDREKGKEEGAARRGWEGHSVNLHLFAPWCHGENRGKVYFNFSFFLTIQSYFDNTYNFPHYVSGLPVTAIGH